MRMRGMVVGVLGTLVLGALVGMCQDGGPGGMPPPPAGMGPGGGPGNFDPAQMQQQMLQMVKDQLAATDEEWKVVGPLVEKVMTLSRQLQARMRGGMRGGPAGDPAAQPAQQSEVDVKMTELRAAVDDPATAPDIIRGNLIALYTARGKMRQELIKAQMDLHGLLTARQEAILVTRGLLD
jgi:hypothetical protein